MKIDVVCTSGSPIGVIPTDLYGNGIGGAENALVSLMEAFARRGHDVTVFNDPKKVGVYSGVSYRRLDMLNHADERDVMIVFRTPYFPIRAARGKRVFWSCDQYTVGNYDEEIFPFADKVVCISPRHAEYFRDNYKFDFDKMLYIDLGVRLEDYATPVEKVKHQAIFNSVPDRGLQILRPMWGRIVEAVPDASLIITSDYRLWGHPEPNNAQHKIAWVREKNVKFVGKVPRAEMVKYQQQSEVLLYPAIYDELFCIAVAECQVAGAIPVVRPAGAILTTTEYGYKVNGAPDSLEFQKLFIEKAVEALTKPQERKIEECKRRFSWDAIAQQWEGQVFA